MTFKLPLILLFHMTILNAQNTHIASPRIYYHEEKLMGTPIETPQINVGTFDFILRNAQSTAYISPEKSELQLVNGVLESVMIGRSTFAYSTIRRDGISYEAKEGLFYLPEAIIFFDISDFTYPSEYFFIAKINNQLEFRRCEGGEDIIWHQTADRHTEVTDSDIIKKANETIEELKNRITVEIQQARAEEEKAKEQKQAERSPISNEKRAAYTELTNICMEKSRKKETVLSAIDELEELDEDDDEYSRTFNHFRMYMNHNGIAFLITLDWKESIAEMEAWVEEAVKENFNKDFTFDRKGEYDDSSSVSDKGFFGAFDSQLRMLDLQISFIDTGGDEYVLFVHRVNTHSRVKQLLEILELPYQSIYDLGL